MGVLLRAIDVVRLRDCDELDGRKRGDDLGGDSPSVRALLRFAGSGTAGAVCADELKVVEQPHNTDSGRWNEFSGDESRTTIIGHTDDHGALTDDFAVS